MSDNLRALLARLFGHDHAVHVVEDETQTFTHDPALIDKVNRITRPDITPNELTTIAIEQVIDPNTRHARPGHIHTTVTGRMEVNRFGAPRQLTPDEVEDHEAFLQDVRDMDDRKEGGS